MSSNKNLSHEDLNDIVKTTISQSFDLITGSCEESRKEWCVEKLTQVLETFDNAIPVIGIFLDNPIVDNLEKNSVRALVEWGWTQFYSNTHPKV